MPKDVLILQIRTRSSSLNLCDILLPEAELLVDSQYVLTNRQRSHAIGVMWYTTKGLCALSSSEGLPPSFGATVTSMHCK